MQGQNYQEKDVHYHNAIADEYDHVVVDPRLTINNLVWGAAKEKIRPGSLMLDLGCGTGHATVRCGGLFTRCIAVDHSPGMLGRAEQKFRESGLAHVTVVQSEITDFLRRQAAESVDAVFCVGVLHHLKQPEMVSLLAEIRRVLVPAGQFVTSEPRQIDPHGVPAQVNEWNSRSIAPSLQYSRSVDDTDEWPIDEGWLISMLYALGFTVEYISHHWELFPTSRNPSATERAELGELHRRFGFCGNALTLIAHRAA